MFKALLSSRQPKYWVRRMWKAHRYTGLCIVVWNKMNAAKCFLVIGNLIRSMSPVVSHTICKQILSHMIFTRFYFVSCYWYFANSNTMCSRFILRFDICFVFKTLFENCRCRRSACENKNVEVCQAIHLASFSHQVYKANLYGVIHTWKCVCVSGGRQH